jgi:hypothetical protein
MVPAHRLPVLGTVGDLPPAEESLILESDARGRVFADGKALNQETLRDLLMSRSDAARVEEGARASKLSVVLRVDRDLPWLGTRWLMQACVDPRVRVNRVFFAAVPEAGGEEGAFAAFLPNSDYCDMEGAMPLRLPVLIREGGGEAIQPRRDLYPDLRWQVVREDKRSGGTIQADLDADPSVPTGLLLETVDLCWRAGIRSFVFKGGKLPGPDETPESAIASLPPVKGFFAFRAGETEVPAAPDGIAFLVADQRVSGRFAGQAEPPPFFRFDFPVSTQPNWPPPGITSSSGPGPALAAFRWAQTRSDSWAKAEEAPAVDAALDWLSRHQSPGGFWDCDGFESMCKEGKCGGAGARSYDVGVSGLAALAFLGVGETYKTARYGSVVRNVLKYLKRIQDPDGCFGPRVEGTFEIGFEENGSPLAGRSEGNKFVYGHAIAALAMAETYGMTQSPLFKASAQNGINFVLLCQNPYLAWRYGVRPQDNDTAVTGWMVLALREARDAGLEVDPAAFDGAAAWLDRVTDPATGRTGYTALGDGPVRPHGRIDLFPTCLTESLTAEAVFTRILCGAKVEDGMVTKGADRCMKVLPLLEFEDESSGDRTDFYYWHFGTLAMFQVGGDRWMTWNESMKKAVLVRQRRDSKDDRRGSWDPVDPWGADGGRVYATAINTLTLETPVRYKRFGTAR